MQKRYDVIVIGAGSGLRISSEAASRGLKVAIIEPGPFGGTCLNRGCIPSKMLIQSANVVEEIKRAHLFGIKANVTGIDWQAIARRVAGTINPEAKEIEHANRKNKNVAIYKTTAKFIGRKTLQVGK